MAVRICSLLVFLGMTAFTMAFWYWNHSLLVKSHEPALSRGASQTLALIGEGNVVLVLPVLVMLAALALFQAVLVWRSPRLLSTNP